MSARQRAPRRTRPDRPIVALEGVSMRFRQQAVLREINLAIPRGQTVCIIGESGCGKTVMLKLIIGLLRPTTGRVIFDGRDLATLSEAELNRARLRFGFLFQGAALFDSLTIFDNVAFGPREHSLFDEDTLARIVADRIHEVGLPDTLNKKKPAELSGGQRKRVGPGPRPGARPRGHALRRADDGPRPDHDRRDQRADPPDPGHQEDDRRRRHARDEDRGQGRRPRGDALPPRRGSAAASRR